MTEKQTRLKTFKMSEELEQLVEQARHGTGRTVDAQLRYLIKRGLEADGLMPTTFPTIADVLKRLDALEDSGRTAKPIHVGKQTVLLTREAFEDRVVRQLAVLQKGMAEIMAEIKDALPRDTLSTHRQEGQ